MGSQFSPECEGLNESIVVGQLVAQPEVRELPSGSVAASFSLTVRKTGTKTTSVPMSWFDPPVRFRQWMVGDLIIARGSVVRRFYRSGSGALASATEVVVDQAQLARHRSRSLKVLRSSGRSIATAADALASGVP